MVAVKPRVSLTGAQQSPSVALKKKSPQDIELEELTAKLRTLKQAVKYKKCVYSFIKHAMCASNDYLPSVP